MQYAAPFLRVISIGKSFFLLHYFLKSVRMYKIFVLEAIYERREAST